MTIKSDNWIRTQCERPTHVIQHATGSIEFASEPFTSTQQLIKHNQNLLLDLNQKDSLNLSIDIINKTKDGNSILSNSLIRAITEKALNIWKPMIEPFINRPIRENNGKKIISYGLSGFGYDVRLSNKFKVFTNINSSIIDPLNPSDDFYVDFEGEYCILPPNSYLLGHTIEYFRIPKDVLVLCIGKSTYARLGAIVNCTPIEPEFYGQIVIEISNSTNLPLKVYANQGIAQFLFFQSDENCHVSYKDKDGKYQNQLGITKARL